MQELNHHYHQLPPFIQAELSGNVGPLHGLSLVQVTARYLAAVDHWLARKHTELKPMHNLDDIYGSGPLGTSEMEGLKTIVDSQMAAISKNPTAASRFSNLTAESIRYLNQFKNTLRLIHTRAQAAEQYAQRLADEAARHQAQRLAEEVARQHAQLQAAQEARQQAQLQAKDAALLQAQHLAEQAAHLHAQRQAEEAARHQAQRQAEEAARHQVQRTHEDTAVFAVQPYAVDAAIQQLLQRAKATLIDVGRTPEAEPLGHGLFFMPGPAAITVAIDRALLNVAGEIRVAVSDYLQKTDSKSGIPAIEALSAMAYAFKQNGIDTQVMAEAVGQH